MERRNFLKVAGAGALIAVSPSLLQQKLYASNGKQYIAYERVQLTDAAGAPLKVSALKKEVNYVFNYPYASTPAILLDLNSATSSDVKLSTIEGEEYIWKSGVGKDRTVVAFSAICSHQLAHPTPNDSMLQFVDAKTPTAAYEKSSVIVCSSHLSSFDPANGNKRLSGPAEDPLPAIVIEIDEDDSIWAVGVLGPDRFHEYFKAFKPEFKKFYGGKRKAKKKVKDSAKTLVLNEYTKEIIQY
ncbi:MAG: sulfur oxidation protein [Epsilonproteobacteria bacterium]|nr:MAG: sulfur oxidation protein [Campylobacterota bacterium]